MDDYGWDIPSFEKLYDQSGDTVMIEMGQLQPGDVIFVGGVFFVLLKKEHISSQGAIYHYIRVTPDSASNHQEERSIDDNWPMTCLRYIVPKKVNPEDDPAYCMDCGVELVWRAMAMVCTRCWKVYQGG